MYQIVETSAYGNKSSSSSDAKRLSRIGDLEYIEYIPVNTNIYI